MSLIYEILSRQPKRYENKLFSVTDDYEIFCHFMDVDIELGETVESPLREDDRHGSFGLFEPTRVDVDREGTLFFKDLGTGQMGDVFTFCRRYSSYRYNIFLTSKKSIIKFIDSEMGLGIFKDNGEARDRVVRPQMIRKEREVFYKTRPFTPNDLKYWNSLGVEEELLKEYNTASVKYLLGPDGTIRQQFRVAELAFVYEILDKIKLYRPKEDRKFKFRNTCPGNDPRYYQGYNQLKLYDTLVITKSMKDVLCFVSLFREMELEVDCIAPHAESINLDEDFLKMIQKHYKRIIIVADYDLAGVKFANKYKKLGFEIQFISTSRIIINGRCKVIKKDISDFYEIKGRDKSKKLIKEWKL